MSVASESLGLSSLLKDWGVQVRISICMDASAGIAMGSRRGLGKSKHVDTVFHWIQSYVTNGRIKLVKVHTSQMLADMLTKPVNEVTCNKHLKGMSFDFLEGRHHLALDL